MAVFGVTGRITESLNKEEQMLRAVKAALAILDHIEATDYGEEIKIGVGMNSGPSMIGYVGTQERVELTAVGDVTNVAFRLQKLARPNRLLVGPETAIGIAGKLEINDLGLHEIEGRSQLIRIFEVLRKK
jgi:adenylate cyclase